jgi:hypothetical protein
MPKVEINLNWLHGTRSWAWVLVHEDKVTRSHV